MIFTQEDMRAAEQMAWDMLDHLHHRGVYANLDDYAYFYFRNKMVFDPWMNEKSQGLPWPNHEDPRCAVDPVKYYGVETIENYLVHMFQLAPFEHPEITAKVKEHLDEDGRIVRMTPITPLEVFVAMTPGQAEEEHGYVCIGEHLPDSERIYFDMLKLPEYLVEIVECGWQREIVFKKKDAKTVFNLLYPKGYKKPHYRKLINRVNGDMVRIIGFGD